MTLSLSLSVSLSLCVCLLTGEGSKRKVAHFGSNWIYLTIVLRKLGATGCLIFTLTEDFVQLIRKLAIFNLSMAVISFLSSSQTYFLIHLKMSVPAHMYTS